MDLIYADENRKDVGILDCYTMDMAYGDDENNFECVIDRTSHCCEAGYYLYVEGKEYGGIIDSIKVDTESDEITYIGRTWHGILENKIICPEEGQDYLVLYGDANEVLQQLIENMHLSSLFVASTEESGIDIPAYQMNRYITGYTGIRKMLRESDAKLNVQWKDGMVELSAVPRIDYSQDEEFDTSQVDFSITKNFRPVNHIICLGQGDLADRAVIHVFTDENGGIQPYATKDEPLQDSDYILDTRSQVLFDQDEVVEALDYSNTDITLNYILLTSKPSDWDKKYDAYYTAEIDDETDEATGKFKSVEADEATAYKLQKSKPSDWSTNFSDYFYLYNDGVSSEYKSVEGVSTYSYTVTTSKPSDWDTNYGSYYQKAGSDYITVPAVVTEKYSKQKAKPSDWKTNYGEYYYWYTDGTQSEYKKVEGVQKSKYTVQTQKPTDWSTSYSSYYKKKKAGGYESVTGTGKKKNVAPKWKKKTYYTKENYYIAPNWAQRTRYTYSKVESAPAWKASTYYRQDTASNAPTWVSDKYYTYTETPVAPTWLSGTYYRQVSDQYAVMVAEAIEMLDDYHASDELTIALEETDQTYDVGDIVGTVEQTTGIESVQEVIKKVIKIENDDVSITYEVN